MNAIQQWIAIVVPIIVTILLAILDNARRFTKLETQFLDHKESDERAHADQIKRLDRHEETLTTHSNRISTLEAQSSRRN